MTAPQSHLVAAAPLLTAVSPTARRGVSGLLVLCCGGFVAYFGLKLTGLRGPWIDFWLFDALLFLSGATCAARAVFVPAERRVWAALSGAVLVWSAGEVYWSVAVAKFDEAPFPSPADAGYLSFYPLAYLGLALLLKGHATRLPRSVWLDGAVAALGVAALACGLAIGPILASGEGPVAAVVTNAAYPIADLVLLMTVMAMVTLSGGRPGGAWLLIGSGLGLLGLTDTLYLYDIARGTYADGDLIEAGWPGAMTLLALAAWQSPREAQGPRVDSWASLAAPAACGIAALGLLLYADGGEVSRSGVVLAAATIVTAGLRTALTFREVQALAVSRHQARTDELTGLGNRRALYEALGELADEPTGLLLVDLDRFKELNDTLGHLVGDRLLERIASRLQATLVEERAVTRLGGDEFAVLLRPGADADAALAAATALRAAVEQPVELNGTTVRIEASVGIALYPAHGDTGELLLQRADLAMYEAKRARIGTAQWVPGGEQDARERLELFGRLRDAIADGEIVLHYQPQRDLRAGRISSVEALVRWEHPERGLLGPQYFVPVVEQTDLMRPLTDHVLAAALRQLAAWRSDGMEIGVSVNVSVADLLDLDFPESVRRALEDAGVPAAALTLEITENVVMSEPVRVDQVLSELRDLGVDLALDDFGTGYSSLSWLRHLPVCELKIDRSFVMAMTDDPSNGAIVRATVDLAGTLGLRVVAEGIEDAGTLEALEVMGCDLVQGYHLSRPVPAAGIEALLRAEFPGEPLAGLTPELPTNAAGEEAPGFRAQVADQPGSDEPLTRRGDGLGRELPEAHPVR